MKSNRSITQNIITAVGLVLTVWFILPIVTFGILNIGNATGITAGVLLTLYGLFAPKVNRMLSELWKRALGKIAISVIAVILSACVLCAAVMSVNMAASCSKKPNESDVVVVLGCKVIGTSPSLMLSERLKAAEDYLKKNENVVCILSGGQGSDERISEAEAMYRYLVGSGISEDRFILEEKSTSTRENIMFSAEILRQYNLGNNIAIVTNEFHEYRAQMLAKDCGLNASAIPGKTHWWLFATYVVREWYGILYEHI